jgi:hypothetical protein
MIQDPGLQVKAAETDDEPSPTSTNELDTPSALVITVSARLSEYEKWSAEKRTLDMSTESGHRMVIWKGQGLPMSTTGCQKAQDTSTVISRRKPVVPISTTTGSVVDGVVVLISDKKSSCRPARVSSSTPLSNISRFNLTHTWTHHLQKKASSRVNVAGMLSTCIPLAPNLAYN